MLTVAGEADEVRRRRDYRAVPGSCLTWYNLTAADMTAFAMALAAAPNAGLKNFSVSSAGAERSSHAGVGASAEDGRLSAEASDLRASAQGSSSAACLEIRLSAEQLLIHEIWSTDKPEINLNG